MKNELKSILLQALILLASLMVAILVIALSFFPNRIEDLSLNLISEIIGTIWVIFCLDRLLGFREEIRQLPTKSLWCSRLLDINDQLLINILPERFRKTSDKIYQFRQSGLYAIPRLDLLELDKSSNLIPQVQEILEQQAQYDFVAPLSLAKEHLDKIIERSSLNFKNTEMILLLNFDHSLDRCLERSTTADLNDESSRQDIVIALTLVVIYAIEVKIWLQKVISDNFVLLLPNHNIRSD